MYIVDLWIINVRHIVLQFPQPFIVKLVQNTELSGQWIPIRDFIEIFLRWPIHPVRNETMSYEQAGLKNSTGVATNVVNVLTQTLMRKLTDVSFPQSFHQDGLEGTLCWTIDSTIKNFCRESPVLTDFHDRSTTCLKSLW